MIQIFTKPLFYIFIFVTYTSVVLGQTAKFTEIFDEADGATSGSSAEGIPWNCVYSPCDNPSTGIQPAVIAGTFRDNNSDGSNKWTSGSINISQCQKISFSMDYWTPDQWSGSGSNNLEACDESGNCACDIFNSCMGDCKVQWDFIYVELKLDGSIVYSDTIGLVASQDPTTYTFDFESACLAKGQYTNATISVITQTWAGDEEIYFDNVSLSCYEFPDFSLVNPSPLCRTDAPVQLDINPPGGTYSGGPYVNSTGLFDPQVAGAGIHPVNYEVNSGPCSNDTTIQIQVIAPTKPTFDPIPAQCPGGINPLPGVSNEGISGNWSPAFDPDTTTTYIFTPDMGQCADTTSVTLTIYSTPVLDFPGGINICEGTCQSITLSVTGGSGSYDADLAVTSPINFTIPTIVINGSITFTICYEGLFPSFDPATFTLTVPPLLVPPGTNVTFALNNLIDKNTGCHGILSGSSNTSITVLSNPSVSVTPVGPLCSDDDPVTLTGTPSGGVWTGQGVTNDTFDPGSVSPGSYTVTYTFTDTTGCMGSDSMVIIVNNCGCTLDISVDAGDDITTCDSLSINLSGIVMNGTGYYWQTSGSGTFNDPSDLNAIYTPGNTDFDAGSVTLSLVVPDPDGSGPCSEVSDQMTITFDKSPTFTIFGNNPICTGACGTLTIDFNSGSGPFSGTIAVHIGSDDYIYSVSNYSGSMNLYVCYQDVAPSYDSISHSLYVPLHTGQSQMTISFSDFIDNSNNCPPALTQQVIILLSDPVDLMLTPLGEVCVFSPPIALEATPPGGVWSGNGVNSGQFDPVIAGIGDQVLTYTYTDANGCVAEDTMWVSVVPCDCANPATVNAGLNIRICRGELAHLQGSGSSPVIWSSSGTGTFDDVNNPNAIYTPSTIDVSMDSVYLYLTVEDPDSSGPCSAVTDRLTLIFHSLHASIDSIPNLCGNAPAISLSGKPNGGIFTGPGVMGTQFDPGLAGAGDHIISYTVVDSLCSDTAKTIIHVIGKPMITLTFVDSVCLNNGLVALIASPAGGIFSGMGVVGNQFNPLIASIGIWPITYTFMDSSSCTWKGQRNIKVSDCDCATPAIADAGVDQVVCPGNPVLLNGSVTTQALWTSSGSGTFEYSDSAKSKYTPSQMDITMGNIQLTLTSIDPDGNGPCLAASHTIAITFDSLHISLDSLLDVCVNGPLVSLSGNPAGGVWSGTGVIGNTFNPTASGIGTFQLTYSVQSANCSTQANASITVMMPTTVSLATFDTMCLGDPPLTLTGGSPSGGEYFINGDFNTPVTSFNPVFPGTYSITYVAGPVGCEGSAERKIIVKDCACNTTISVFAGNDTTLCQGDVISLNGILNGIATGIWRTSGTGYFDDTSKINPTYSPSITDITMGSVLLTFTSTDPDGIGPCLPVNDQMKINFEKKPEIQLSVSQPTCSKPFGNVSINDVNHKGLQYSIDNGVSFTFDNHFDNLSPDSYHLLVRDPSSGCLRDTGFLISTYTVPDAQWDSTSAACNAMGVNSFTLIKANQLVFPIQVSVNNKPDTLISSLPCTFYDLDYGTYLVTLSDTNGCNLSRSFTFDTSSSLSVSIDPLYILDPGQQVTLNPEIKGDFDLIQWDPATYLSCSDCVNPVATPLDNIEYTIEVKDKNGCHDRASLRILINEMQKVFIPNTFTPNRDGINDEFTIFTDDQVTTVKSMKIFDRWGALIFSKSNFPPNEPKLGWDGTFRSKAENPNVFVYLIEVQFNNGDVKIFSGDVTLVH